MAVVEDAASATAVAGEPAGAALVSVEAVLVDLGCGLAAEAAQCAVGGPGQAGWAPTVLVDPARDRVGGGSGPVVELAESAADLDGEATLSIWAAGGQAPPCREPTSAAILMASG